MKGKLSDDPLPNSLDVRGLRCGCAVQLIVSAQALESLPASALSVRNSVVAMSIADAALPAATAATTPASTSALKPDVSRAMASMQQSARRANVYNAAYYDRRVRPNHSPFLLILGIAY